MSTGAHRFCSGSDCRAFDYTALTYEPEDTLREGQDARIEQEAETVSPVFEGQHMYHGQKEAGLWNGAETWSRWVLIGDGLQGNRLHTKLFESGAGLEQDVANILDGPGIQLAECHLQKHAIEGRDQIHVLQAVRQGLSEKDN